MRSRATLLVGFALSFLAACQASAPPTAPAAPAASSPPPSATTATSAPAAAPTSPPAPPRAATSGPVATAPVDEGAALAKLESRSHPLNPPPPALLARLANEPTPFLLYDLDQVAENYYRVRRALRGGQVLYAIKVDPHPRVLRRLVELGSGFDAASRVEIDLALAAGASADQISYGNTVKATDDIRYAFEKGVRQFVVDDPGELAKIAKYAPGSRVFVRLKMGKTNAHYPLTEKFGTDPEHAKALLRSARDLKLIPYGLSFHVGSECYDAKEWKKPMTEIAAIFKTLHGEGIDLRFVDVGGGFPKRYGARPVPTAEQIGDAIQEVVARDLKDVPIALAAEPGRFIIGDAALMATRVVLRAERGQKTWIHLDAGTYNGLSEASFGIKYDVVTPQAKGAPQKFTLAGPTCDSSDVLYRDLSLPGSLAENELVLFLNAGAYAASCSTNFNGFPIPKPVFVQDLAAPPTVDGAAPP